jgi:hypothetical protein
VEAGYLRLVAELDSRPAAVPVAAAGRVARTFLTQALRVSGPDASADVAAALAVDAGSGWLPELGAALAEGAVSREHVDVAVRAVKRVPAHLLHRVDGGGVSGAQRVDHFLTDAARELSPAETARVAAHLVAFLDRHGVDSFDPASVTRRGLRTVVDSTGMLLLRAELDPAAGAVVRAALDLFGAPDPAGSAVDEAGTAIAVPDIRSPGQRGADALTTICRFALAGSDGHAAGDADGTDAGGGTRSHSGSGAGPGDERARILITVTPDQLASVPGAAPATVAGTGEPVGPRLLARWACDSLLQRVLHAPDGAVLNMGRTVRTVTPAQRKALTVRDGGCAIPGCGAPPGWCQAHHVRFWSRGGSSDLDNLVLLCARHHSDIHTGIWSIEMHGQVPWAIPPAWIDPGRRPLRNTTRHRFQQARDIGQRLRDDGDHGDHGDDWHGEDDGHDGHDPPAEE